MNCSQCQSAIPEGAKFCMNCGTALPFGCPNCQAEVPTGAKLCGNCGHALGAAAAPLLEVEALGGIEDKGKAEPGIAYRIVAMEEQQGRLRGIEGLESPLVGRDNEMASLRTAIDELRQGRGQIVSIMGEAGLGKFRRQVGLRHALGAVLRDARWRLGQSQTEAAHIIGVDKASAHRWEAEKTAPNNQRIREAVLRYIRKGDSA
jgi:hypothetical protein